ncbi:hypothetical protein [Cellulomonas xylanilytica]|uniref:Polyketide cyclase n=1 Tax=Cellulomonas xylanilytica TaxID=233583 RepID=A0A510V851_9CELL|nr:hypothetical protein [Cellulomonas xylanilytica]GEK22946.1 hypothetical protein CXY01_34660 [Cellulomonas xylanilytica]
MPAPDVVHTVPTSGELTIDAPRAAVWRAAIELDELADDGGYALVGQPRSGLGAKSVRLGPPVGPHGFRTVMYSEVTALQEPHWITSEVLTSTWEHVETLLLLDIDPGRTRARVTGAWRRPAPAGTDFSELQQSLDLLAAQYLERIAAAVRGS